MQSGKNILALQEKLLALEATLQKVQRRRTWWYRIGLGIIALWVGLSFYTQTSHGQASTPGSLGSRVADLEQRVTKLEKRVTNDEIGNTNFPSAEDASGDKSTQQQISALAKALRTLQDEMGNGRGRIGASVMAPFHVVDEKGGLIFSVDSFEDGVVVRGKNNSFARMGPNNNGSMGFRLYAPGSALASAGMDLQTNFAGDMFVGAPGKAVAAMTVTGGVGDLAILDASGKRLSDLSMYPGGGGVLRLANPSGQNVSVIDANPANGEGRAIFADTGGSPLTKIGVAGNHGDVQIFGPGKGFDLWSHMITGLP